MLFNKFLSLKLYFCLYVFQTSSNRSEIIETCVQEPVVEYETLEKNTGSVDITQDLNNNIVARHRGKREIALSDALTDEDFDFFLNPASWEKHLHHSRRVKRTSDAPNLLSRENATNFCMEKVLGAQFALSCLELVFIDTERIIKQCSDDVLVSK